MNDTTDYGEYLRRRDADQRQIADLSRPVSRSAGPLIRTPEHERLNGLLCDAQLRRSQWASVAATIIERQSYLKWQAELQAGFTDEMKALLLGAAEALGPALGTAMENQKAQEAEYRRLKNEMANLNERVVA